MARIGYSGLVTVIGIGDELGHIQMCPICGRAGDEHMGSGCPTVNTIGTAVSTGAVAKAGAVTTGAIGG